MPPGIPTSGEKRASQGLSSQHGPHNGQSLVGLQPLRGEWSLGIDFSDAVLAANLCCVPTGCWPLCKDRTVAYSFAPHYNPMRFDAFHPQFTDEARRT